MADLVRALPAQPQDQRAPKGQDPEPASVPARLAVGRAPGQRSLHHGQDAIDDVDVSDLVATIVLRQ